MHVSFVYCYILFGNLHHCIFIRHNCVYRKWVGTTLLLITYNCKAMQLTVMCYLNLFLFLDTNFV